jgi:hypothetical protein
MEIVLLITVFTVEIILQITQIIVMMIITDYVDNNENFHCDDISVNVHAELG